MWVRKRKNEPCMRGVVRAALYVDGKRICAISEASRKIEIPDVFSEIYILTENYRHEKQKITYKIQSRLPELVSVVTEHFGSE